MTAFDKILTERGITNDEAARLTGFHRGTIVRHRAGQREISLKSAKRYEECLGISQEDIADDIRRYELNRNTSMHMMQAYARAWAEALSDVPGGSAFGGFPWGHANVCPVV